MKMKDQNSLPILYKEGVVRCWTMHMVMCNLVLQMVLHVQCIHWHGMIQKTKKDAHNAIRASTPGQVIDSPKPPDHIIVDINLIRGIKWPHHLNLSPNSNLIQIPIGLTS